MPKKKPESFVERAKKKLSSISDALNPEKRFGPAAQRKMKKANEEYSGARREKLDRREYKDSGVPYPGRRKKK